MPPPHPAAPPEPPAAKDVPGLSPGDVQIKQLGLAGLGQGWNRAASGAGSRGAPAPGISPSGCQACGREGGNPILRGGIWAPLPAPRPGLGC